MSLEIPPLPDTTILLVEVGSTAHGTGIPGGEDHDELGVVVEKPEQVVGLDERGFATIMQRTQPEGVRSGPGDIDRTLHSLRRFVRLAASGNPSILMSFWAPVEHITLEGEELRALGEAFIGRHVIPRYRGYMQSRQPASSAWAVEATALEAEDVASRGGSPTTDRIRFSPSRCARPASLRTCQTTCQTNHDESTRTTLDEGPLTSPLTCTNVDVSGPRRTGGTPDRLAHNPKVVGSNPTPATNVSPGQRPRRRELFSFGALIRVLVKQLVKRDPRRAMTPTST
ncbi:MAG: nucleotidyltransferase domain-containing protein [Actinomycetota bacterium]